MYLGIFFDEIAHLRVLELLCQAFDTRVFNQLSIVASAEGVEKQFTEKATGDSDFFNNLCTYITIALAELYTELLCDFHFENNLEE